MGKVYKIIPVSLYDMPGLERWLEDMADAGLFPTHIGAYASFTREGRPGTRFRLDPFGKSGSEPTGEQLELYRRAGWEYVCNVGRIFYLFHTADPAAPELHTDLVTLGQSLDRLAKRVRRAKWHHILYPLLLPLIFLLPQLLPASRFDVQPKQFGQFAITLLGLSSPGFLFFLAFMVFTFIHEIREFRYLLALHRNLKDGLPPPSSPVPGKKILRYNAALLLLLPVSILSLVWIFLWRDTVPLEEFDQPYIALADLEETPMATYKELFGSPTSHSDENLVKRDCSILAPVWYTVEQTGYDAEHSPSSMGFSTNPENDLLCYSPDLEMTYVQLTLPSMARMVAESQLDRMRLINLYWEYEEIEYPGLDFVILGETAGGAWQMAALAKDGRVAVFRYGGREKLADHLDLLDDMVTI